MRGEGPWCLILDNSIVDFTLTRRGAPHRLQRSVPKEFRKHDTELPFESHPNCLLLLPIGGLKVMVLPSGQLYLVRSVLLYRFVENPLHRLACEGTAVTTESVATRAVVAMTANVRFGFIIPPVLNYVKRYQSG